MVFASMASRTAARNGFEKATAWWASSLIRGLCKPGVIRTKATSMPSAEVPLMTPATVIGLWAGFCRRPVFMRSPRCRLGASRSKRRNLRAQALDLRAFGRLGERVGIQSTLGSHDLAKGDFDD